MICSDTLLCRIARCSTEQYQSIPYTQSNKLSTSQKSPKVISHSREETEPIILYSRGIRFKRILSALDKKMELAGRKVVVTGLNKKLLHRLEEKMGLFNLKQREELYLDK